MFPKFFKFCKIILTPKFIRPGQNRIGSGGHNFLIIHLFFLKKIQKRKFQSGRTWVQFGLNLNRAWPIAIPPCGTINTDSHSGSL